ncbi:hypothetical protein DZD40_07640, partial [Campylobacter hepaticus]
GGVMASSKKLILSLATISCLSSLALANISGPTYAIPYNQGNNYYYTLLGYYPNTQIRINGNGSTNTLYLGRYAYINYNTDGKAILANAGSNQHLTIDKITNKGIVNGALNVQNQGNIDNGSITIHDIDNQGYIRNVYIGVWKENQGSIKLDSFKNSGLIYNTSDNGILFEGKDVVIDKFINEKIIASNDSTKASLVIGQANNRNDNITIKLLLNKGLIGGEQSKYGILFNADPKNKGTDKFSVNHLINTGVIYGEDVSILFSNATIKNFLNTGTIEAHGQRAINAYNQTEIQHFINSGTIESKSNAAILFQQPKTITNILNTGMISGTVGVAIDTATITNFINTGTIKATHKQTGAVLLATLKNTPLQIENLINTGSIDSQSHGIMIEVGGTINNFYNNGTIKTQGHGITFATAPGASDN